MAPTIIDTAARCAGPNCELDLPVPTRCSLPNACRNGPRPQAAAYNFEWANTRMRGIEVPFARRSTPLFAARNAPPTPDDERDADARLHTVESDVTPLP